MNGVEKRSRVLHQLLRTVTLWAIHWVGGSWRVDSFAGDRHFGMVRGRLLEELPRQARDQCLVVDLAQRQVTHLRPPEISWNVFASLPAKT